MMKLFVLSKIPNRMLTKMHLKEEPQSHITAYL